MPARRVGVRTQMAPVYIDEGLATKLNLLLLDPATGRTRWGAWQALVERLVREWVASQLLDPAEADALRAQSYATTRSKAL